MRFRLFLNDIGVEIDKEIGDESIRQLENDSTICETEKQQIIKARIGQGDFRTRVIEKYKRCIISKIDDSRILIASHIKPWISSNNNERISRENGLLLSPTYDRLFDNGFISFQNDGTVLLSSYFSDDNFNRVGLSKGDAFNIMLTNTMMPFLEFHRDTIFLH